ncbi:MAG: hypothetical protein JWO82_2687 [Akkermansiaceae bacterium]|nr:hypothetical protein [Akkermansiaceae bacterium]
MKATVGRWILFALGLLAVSAISSLAIRDSQPEGDAVKIPEYTAWDEETLTAVSLFPVQDEGRVKPIGTFAGFKMLSLHGARSMEVIGKGDKKIRIKPLGWMMDCLFRPELARQLPTFLLDNSEVVTAVGIQAKSKRDRYSYNDLAPGLERLKQLGQSYQQISARDPKLLKPLEQQTLNLYFNIAEFEFLTSYMGPVRDGLIPSAPGGRMLNVSDAMEAAPRIRADLQTSQDQGKAPSQQVVTIAQLMIDAANKSIGTLLIFPPPGKDDEKWLSVGNRIYNVLEGTTREPEKSVEDIKALEELTRSTGDQATFRAKFTAFESRTVDRAKERGEYKSVPLEANYFSTNWFIYALVWFLMATVTACVMFFTGRTLAGKISMWATVSLLLAGLICLIIPIMKRSLIMGRPPVGNLYDTIIFIDMAIVGLALIVEALIRKRFVLGITPIVGALLIVLARRFEVGEGRDHLGPLNAVLRSNYWLTIHVITITLGYASGLVTALLAIVYVLLRALGLEGDDSSIRRSLTRAVYGCVCLTLLLSLVGTVLGGIWANDSWGRFWGWDPKENGALMIVLWNLAILHARVGGYIKEWGLHLAALFGAIVIGFSWWHVNFLGVGLHNYGFAADKKGTVLAFYAVMLFLIGVGAATSVFERIAKSRREAERKQAKAVTVGH